jgi:hypothetical protein
LTRGGQGSHSGGGVSFADRQQTHRTRRSLKLQFSSANPGQHGLETGGEINSHDEYSSRQPHSNHGFAGYTMGNSVE